LSIDDYSELPAMPFTPTQYLLVSLIILASSVLQGAVGFASGLFGTPLLMLTGMSLPDAVAISLVASAFQNCIAAWQLRREIDFRRALQPILIRLAMLPLGVLALYYVGKQGNALASQIVGVIILSIVAVQQAFRVPPQPHLHPVVGLREQHPLVDVAGHRRPASSARRLVSRPLSQSADFRPCAAVGVRRRAGIYRTQRDCLAVSRLAPAPTPVVRRALALAQAPAWGPGLSGTRTSLPVLARTR
jgi:hypothetical protein